jgi:polysaccharide transporter, PST family
MGGKRAGRGSWLFRNKQAGKPAAAAMSTAVLSTRDSRSSGDSFAYGVLIMLTINVGQRVIGLLRNLGFCQFLSDAELGHWALANSFFIIAAPLAVLGLPGSFGKFVEYYRLRNCLRSYLTRVAIVCLVSTLLFVAGIVAASDSFAWLVYGDTATLRVVAWTGVALLAQVAYNFVFEATLSLRHVRVISWMQMAHGVCFTLFGVAGLALSNDWSVLLPAYSASCMLGTVVGAAFIWSRNQRELSHRGPLLHGEMWPRILPFAAALWLTNLLTNSFELSDRYMLLHYCPSGISAGQALVGQYYCGRIIPNLLTSVALMLGGILLPYLSKDWEAGNRQAVETRMRQLLAVVSLLFTSVSVVAILASPLLFDGLFSGRYQGAHAILNLSLVQCMWSSLAIISGTYLLCAEKVHTGSINLLCGLLVNIGLNLPLIHYFGLTGSVLATTLANLLLMLLTFHALRRLGCNLGGRTIALAFLPLIVLFGSTTAAVGIAIIVFLAGRTEWILSAADRVQIDEFVIPKLRKSGIGLSSLWP